MKTNGKYAVEQKEAFEIIRRKCGLRGRQRITDVWMDGDGYVFGSNAKGGYGETLTFHYTDAQLAAELGLDASVVKFDAGKFFAFA